MKAAMQNSKIRNAVLLIYVLGVLLFSAAARAGELTLNPIMNNPATVQMREVVGQITISTEGDAFLVVSDTDFYQLHAQDYDLTAYNGHEVVVKGYELVQKVGPVYELASLDPLRE